MILPRAQRLKEDFDRFAAVLPLQLHDWTLADPGPFVLDGNKRLQVKIKCKCGHYRFARRDQWAGRTFNVRSCRACYERSGRRRKPGVPRPSALRGAR